jgi:hypothetical protein
MILHAASATTDTPPKNSKILSTLDVHVSHIAWLLSAQRFHIARLLEALITIQFATYITGFKSTKDSGEGV